MLAVKAQLASVPGKVIYIDTEGGFSPERVREIATANGLDAESVLENICVLRTQNHEQQLMAPGMCSALISSSDEPFRLVCVDSIIAHFRSEFSGRGELSVRQQLLSRHMSDWNKRE